MSRPSFLSKFGRKLFDPGEGKTAPLELPDQKALVREAALELQAALSLFNHVTERELVDYAIFRLNAAERHLVYLLQEARRQQEPGGKE